MDKRWPIVVLVILILIGTALIYYTYMYFHGMPGYVDKYFGTN